MTTSTVIKFPIERFLAPEALEKLTVAEREAVSAYLEAFAIFDEVVCKCRCGLMLPGLLGSFGWGIVHGEGACGGCGWPARGAHRIDVGRQHPLFFETILPYHPDCVESEAVPS